MVYIHAECCHCTINNPTRMISKKIEDKLGAMSTVQ